MKKVILVVILLLCLAVTAFLLLRGRGATEQEDNGLGLSSTPEEGERQKVFLYFTSRDGLHLSVTTAEINITVSKQEKVRQVFELLRQGPGEGGALFPVLPQEAVLQNVFLAKKGCLYLDFGPELSDTHPGGSTAEILSSYAIVNSMIDSFQWVNNVRFLCEGKEMETLAGHINHSGKLVFNNDIIVLVDGDGDMQDVDEELGKDIIQ